jgi:hypothetical protein
VLARYRQKTDQTRARKAAPNGGLQKWQPVLAINPWAEHPVPSALRTLSRFEAEGDRWAFRDGQRFADILGMPTPWPPDETG